MSDNLELEFRVWSASILNAIFLAVQLWRLWQTRSHEGISVFTFCGFIYMQATYAELGYREDQGGLFWGMLASAIISTLIVGTTVYLRYSAKKDHQ